MRRTLDAVRTAVTLSLEFDSETLPLLDHYLRQVPSKSHEAASLLAAMTGCYFGETVRQQFGGRWKVESNDPASWRIVLPGGLSFAPSRLALSAILESEEGEGNADFQAPPKLMVHLEQAMERLGAVSETEYYSLSCRYDTIEHLQEVMLATAAAAQEAQQLTN